MFFYGFMVTLLGNSSRERGGHIGQLIVTDKHAWTQS